MKARTDDRSSAASEKPLNWTSELVVCLLLSVAFGIFVCLASNTVMHRQEQRSQSVEMERNILRGQPIRHGEKWIYLSAWQNRILFPALLELGIRLGGFTPNGWYLLIRWLLSIVMFASFWMVLRMDAQAGIKLAAAGLLLLTYCLVTTFYNWPELSSDFPEAMFTAFFIAASLRRKRVLLLVISAIAAANRESAAFAGVIWFFLYAVDERRKINWRETGYAALVSICSYGSAIALRYAFGGAQAVKYRTQIFMLRSNYYQIKSLLLHPSPFSWGGLIFCFLLPCVLWIGANRKHLILTHKRLLMSAGVIAFMSLFFGTPSEPRIFIMSMILTIFVAVSAEVSSNAAYSNKVISGKLGQPAMQAEHPVESSPAI